MSYNNESPIPAAPEGAGCPLCVSSLIVQPSCGEAGGGGAVQLTVPLSLAEWEQGWTKG